MKGFVSEQSEIVTVVDPDWPERVVELWNELDPRVVVIPGGRTPRLLYPALLEAAPRWRIDAAEFFFSDERCVPPTHRASNFGAAYRVFFRHLRATVHRMPSETCDPKQYDATLRARQIDLAVLGIGEDGHTASLFSGSSALEATGPRAPLVKVVEGPDLTRLTLTPRALNSATVLAFIAAGKSKAEVIAGLVRQDMSLVASMIRGQEGTYVFCDPLAGSKISS